MKKLALHWKIMIGMLLGILWALFSGANGLNGFTIDWIDPFGKIFINCLKFIAVPLVLFSIITGVAGMGDPKQLGRMGGKTLGMYLVTTIFSVSVGLMVVNLVKPGVQTNENTRLNNRLQYELWAEDVGVDVKDGRHELLTATPTQIAAAKGELVTSRKSNDYKETEKKREKAQTTKGAKT